MQLNDDSSTEKRELMRSLLLFTRFSRDTTVGDSMKGRIDQLRACLLTQHEGNEVGSRAEREISEIVKRLLSSQSGFTVENNVWLDGCFSADIVITRVAPDRSKSIFNIEVDGPSHLLPTKQRLSRLRDQHLQEACGVVIVRIPLLKPTGEWLVHAEGYEAAVQEVLQRLQLLPPPA